MAAQQPGTKHSPALPLPDFRALFESAPTALLVVLPDEPKFTIIAASNAYQKVSGVKRESLLGHGVFEVFPDNPDDLQASGVRNVRASFERTITTAAPDRMPWQRYDVGRPAGDGAGFEERYWSALNTPVLDSEGRVSYILHSVEEVTEKVRMEQRADAAMRDLQRSEKRFRQLAETSTLGLVIADLEGGLSYLNPAMQQLLGYTEEEVAAGLVRWDQLTPPGYAQVDAEAVRQIALTGRCAPFEKVYVSKDGRRTPILIAASALEPVKGRTEVAAFILDLTQRKQSERDAFLVQLDDATRPLVDPLEITNTAARLLGEHLNVNRCAYADVEPDEDTFNLMGDYNRGVVSIVGRYSFTQFGAECLRLMRAGQTYVVVDSETDPRAASVLDSYRLTRIRSVICVPLLKAGRFVAAMAAHQTTPRDWRQEEVELVRAVASRCWESIERAQVSRALQASERRLRLAQRVARIGSFEWWIKENRIVWTPELEALYGLPEGTFEGTLLDWSKRVAPPDAERVTAGMAESVASRQPDYAYEFQAVLPDGTLRWLRGQAQFFYDETGAPERMLGVNIDIDAQKQAEAHLHQQWRIFDTALSNTPDFTYTFDLEGRFSYVNRALLCLWQKPLEEALGKSFFELDYPLELAHRLQRQIQQVIETKHPVRDQTPFTGPTGETRHYEYIFVPVLSANGQVESVAGSTRDITERKQAEELIEDDRRRWRELILQAPAAIAVLRGPEHRFQSVNAEYARLVSRPAEDILGMSVLKALPEMEGQTYVNLLNRVYQTGEPFSGHESLVRLDRGDGTLQDRYVNFAYLATRDVAGHIDGVFAHITDVTSFVKARKQVEESEERYRFLAESIPQMVWTATPDGGLDYVSRQVAAYFGMSSEALLGTGWLAGVHPDDEANVVERWRNSLNTGHPYETEFRLRRGEDGAFRWFLVRAHCMPATDGKVVCWVGTCTDIHDQKEGEAELRRMNRELEEFSYVASHDLQEPLRMVNIYTQLILKRLGGDDATLRAYAAFVRQGVMRMEALIKDLLTFSRNVHAEHLPAGAADLSASLNEAMSVLKDRIEENGAVVVAQPLPTVRGDQGQISHVFQNLLSNALKYRRQEAPPEIQISAELDGDKWIVSVRDNGIGFDPQYAERIFGLFKRLHKEEYPGTGLGLAICQRTVERYGGRIWAEGKPGQGATFHFSLPRVQ
jgi:PAS domain S-box-containing protein